MIPGLRSTGSRRCGSHGASADLARIGGCPDRHLRLQPGRLDGTFGSIDDLTVAAVEVVASGFTSGWDELQRLKKQNRQAQGKPIEVKVFPEAEHSMLLLPSGYTPGYFGASGHRLIDAPRGDLSLRRCDQSARSRSNPGEPRLLAPI